jgi:hypothetical protein
MTTTQPDETESRQDIEADEPPDDVDDRHSYDDDESAVWRACIYLIVRRSAIATYTFYGGLSVSQQASNNPYPLPYGCLYCSIIHTDCTASREIKTQSEKT